MSSHAAPAPEASKRTFWSTQLVARRLKVSEATVKRWSDEGLLACYRTPGGHRKFSPQDVAAFVAARHFDPERGVGAQVGRADDAIQLMLAVDADGLFALARKLTGNGVPLENLLDEVFTKALVEVGERWACGTLEVAEEHTATSAVISCLARMEPLVAARQLSGSAIAACLPGERHDVATRMASLLFAHRGIRCATPGADVPRGSLIELVKKRRASIVALSASSATLSSEALTAELKELVPELNRLNVKLFVGGTAFTEAVPLPPGVTRVANMRALAAALSSDLRRS
jgi:excisionase family DNA binding protein